MLNSATALSFLFGGGGRNGGADDRKYEVCDNTNAGSSDTIGHGVYQMVCEKGAPPILSGRVSILHWRARLAKLRGHRVECGSARPIAPAGSTIGSRSRTLRRRRCSARRKKIGALSDGRAGGVPEMTNLSPFFEFVLLLVVPGALTILLVTLLWTGET